MKNRLIVPLALAASVVVTSCGDRGPVSPSVEPPVFGMAAMGPALVEGEIGPGALYALYLPEAWNGDLVLYAHGWTDPAAPPALPGFPPNINDVRDALLELGYGVAWSSYSESGYAVKDGLTRTRQLRGLFAANFGMPDKTYLMGHSMGGLISLMAAEKNPGLYAGALPMCGPVGGGQMILDYVYHARVLFDYFFPGVIPGNAMDVPDGLDFGSDVAPAVIGAVLSNPATAMEMAGVDQIGLPYTDFGELLNSILVPIFFNVAGTEDFLARTHHGFFDNLATTYTGSSDDAAVNAGVDRFRATPDARNYLEHWYLPSGSLKIPVLMLHTTLDPAASLAHMTVYEAIADAAGASDFLVQRVIDRYGHCTFTTTEHVDAFPALVRWVEPGVAPTP
jgi:pimeloyl-ACP methyl ester carboxylesterase